MKLVKEVELVFFIDDGSGRCGLTHKQTAPDNNGGEGFNAFYDGRGIFHDVFEHSHEFVHPYFKGEAAMNIGGEMAAMGSLAYYMELIGQERFSRGSYVHPSDIIVNNTFYEVQQAIEDNDFRFGDKLISFVPYQRPVDNSYLEYAINKYFERIQNVEAADESGTEYKKSVTRAKLANLHRFGFRMAKGLVPNHYDNGTVLYEFITKWDEFCKENDAEKLMNDIGGIKIQLYHKHNQSILWRAMWSENPQLNLDAETVPKLPTSDYE